MSRVATNHQRIANMTMTSTGEVCRRLNIRPKQLLGWVRRGHCKPTALSAGGRFRWAESDVPQIAAAAALMTRYSNVQRDMAAVREVTRRK
jgi:predicted site-specific integrase-resolvase